MSSGELATRQYAICDQLWLAKAPAQRKALKTRCSWRCTKAPLIKLLKIPLQMMPWTRPKMTSTSCGSVLRIASCSALQPLTAESQKRAGRIPSTDRIGMATAPQDLQQRLGHDGSPAATWLGQQTHEICKTLQRDRVPKINLSHNEDQDRDRRIGQCLQLHQRSVPIPFLLRSNGTARSRAPSEMGGQASSAFGTTSVEGVVQAPQLGLIALPNLVPLICPQLHRSIGSNSVTPWRRSPPAWQAC